MFFDIRKEIPSFYIDFSISKPRATPATRTRRASESQPSSSEAELSSTDFFQNPPNPPRALSVYDVITFLVTSSIWDFYFDICERHILPARVSTPALKFAFN